MDRRKLIKSALSGAGILASSTAIAAQAGKFCGLTPVQTEGPFYPIKDQLDKDTDLVYVRGSSIRAKGEIVFVGGRVVDQYCKPVEGALVEIWQASSSGKYNHPSDPNPAPLDRNFQHWGRSTSDKNGEFEFRTIIPGAYPATPTWNRPPHIHFKVHLRGFEELTTQMYFEGHSLNKTDRILQSLSGEEKKNVIIKFKKVDGKKKGYFTIGIRSI